MRRRIFLGAAVALSLAVVGGCGGNSNGTYSPNLQGGSGGGGNNPPPVDGVGLAAGPWPRFHQNNQSRGQGVGRGPDFNPVEAWSYGAGAQYSTGGPVIGPDGTLYVNDSGSANVYAVNRTDGSRKWQYTLTGQTGATFPESGTVGANGMVFFGSSAPTGILVALDAATGAERWRFTANEDTNTPIRSSPVITPGNVLIFASTQYVYGVNANTGARIWRAPLLGSADRPHPALSPDGNTVYVAEGEGGIYAFNAANGTELWRLTNGIAAPTSPVSVDQDGNLYVATGNRVVSINPTNRTVRWTFNVPAPGTVSGAPTVVQMPTAVPTLRATRQVQGGERIVVFADSAGNIRAVSAASGTQRWEEAVGTPIEDAAIAADADGDVYVGGQSGLLYGFDGFTGLQKWAHNVGSPLHYAHPALDERTGWIYVGADKVYGLIDGGPR